MSICKGWKRSSLEVQAEVLPPSQDFRNWGKKQPKTPQQTSVPALMQLNDGVLGTELKSLLALPNT